MNLMRQSACLVFNPITIDYYASFFNCKHTVRRVILYDGRDLKLLVGCDQLLGPSGFYWCFSFAPDFQLCCLPSKGSSFARQNIASVSPRF